MTGVERHPPKDERHLLTVAFDADDTLWHNEDLFQEVHQEFAELLAPGLIPPLSTTASMRCRWRTCPASATGSRRSHCR